MRLLAETPGLRRRFLIFADIFSLLLPLILYASRRLSGWFFLSLQTLGYCWAAVIVSLIPLALLAEPVYLGLKLTRPGFSLRRGPRIFAGLAVLESLMIIGGFINARSPRIRELEIELPGRSGPKKELTVAAFSDLHAGKLVNQAWVSNIVKKVNSLSPDIILMVGDILGDRELEKNGALAQLAGLKAPLGKFAVLGNHEFYLDTVWSTNILKSAGITVLQDQYVSIADTFILAGRKDFTVQRKGGRRLPLKAILPENHALPVILMDHNPSNLSEAAAAKVAFQLSGHTHNGQLFPVNFIVGFLYEKTWGELVKGNTRYYVSCGVGIWGPPVRTSSIPEILYIKVRFKPGDRD